MSDDGDELQQLRRLRAVTDAELPLPPDLSAWVIRRVAATLPAAIALQERNALIVEAARSVPGVPWTRAKRLAAISADLPRVRPNNRDATARLLAQAAVFSELPTSAKHYSRIIENVDMRPLPMSTAGAESLNRGKDIRAQQ